jgi:hypothetical protein
MTLDDVQIPVLQGLVIDRIVWLRLRRVVILRLYEGYPRSDIAAELLKILGGMLAPNYRIYVM